MQKILTKTEVESIYMNPDCADKDKVFGICSKAADAASFTANIATSYVNLGLQYLGADFQKSVNAGEDMYVMRFMSDYLPSNDDIPQGGIGFASSPNHLIPEYWYNGARIINGAIFAINMQNEERMYAYFDANTRGFVKA